MKVLLFVQTGDARPKCAGEYAPQEMRYADRERRTGTRRQHALKRAADRWWLVECENADAGREVIALAELVAAARRYRGADDSVSPVITGKTPKGHILASGGKQ